MMKDRISFAVFWCSAGLIAGSLATLRLPVVAVVIAGTLIVLACLAEWTGVFEVLFRPRKRALPRSSSGRGVKRAKKVKA
jgi:hypothetical protein